MGLGRGSEAVAEEFSQLSLRQMYCRGGPTEDLSSYPVLVRR